MFFPNLKTTDTSTFVHYFTDGHADTIHLTDSKF